MLKKFPIRLKFIILYAVMTVFTIVIYIASTMVVNHIIALQNESYHLNTKGAEMAYDINVSLARQASKGNESMLKTSDAAALEAILAEYDKETAELAAEFGEMETILAGSSAAASFAPIYQDYQNTYVPAADAFVPSVRSGNASAAQAALATVNAEADKLSPALNTIAAELDAASEAGIARTAAIPRYLIIGYIVYTLVYLVIVYITAHRIVLATALPMQTMEKAARRIAVGDVDVSVDYEANDEVGSLAGALSEMVEAIRQQADVLTVMADGDYTVDIPVRSPEDIVNKAISQMLKNNNRMVSQIRTSSIQVSAGADQISQGAQSLAAGSTQQAASVDDFSQTVGAVMEQTQATADRAKEALAQTAQAGELMQKSLASMDELRQAMTSIDESAKSITRVNKVIDDIAFQTNILALNAAVEAARAGQHGKGFAVVADEVRNLAAKSAAAAKETTTLVEGSSQRVQEGDKIVERARTDMTAVADIAGQNHDLMKTIAAESQEQAASMGDLSRNIDQISHVVQSNSAQAQQSAASAEEMNAQAAMLTEVVQRFRLKDAALPGREPQPDIHYSSKEALPPPAGEDVIF